MKLFRALFSVIFSLTLAVGLLPAASVFADGQVPSWGDPNVPYGAIFDTAIGNFEGSGVAFGESRPAELDRWQSEFAAFQGQGSVWMDKYDVFDLIKQLPTDNFDTKNGYGLIPWNAPDKIKEFVQNANGNPNHVLQLLNDFQTYWPLLTDNGKDEDKVKALATIFYGIQPRNSASMSLYVRSWMLVLFSGGRLDHNDNTPTNPFDPGQINGTAHFLTSPWPKINQATVQGSTIHVDFTTYGLNFLHRPTAKITNGTDEITQDFGWVNNDGAHDTYNGMWDVPLDQVTQKLGPLDKLSVVVDDGYGREAKAPLGQNIQVTYNWAADYTVPYTTGQPASFTQALVLTKTSGTAPDPADKFLGDTLQWSYSVDGGPWQPLTVLPDTAKVFDSSGRLKDKIVITTDMLNTIPGRVWGGGTHKIQVKVSASPGDQGKYLFTSEDSGGPGPSAVVTVTFAEAHRFGQPPGQSFMGKLDLRWAGSLPDPSSPSGRKLGGLPSQVAPGGSFVAPVEISNNGDIAITTTLNFYVDGNAVIERHYSCSCPKCSPPPPDFMNFPLHGVTKKTFTIPPRGVVFWDVLDGITYSVDGYQGPPTGSFGCIDYDDYVLGHFIPTPDGNGDEQSPPVVGPVDVGYPAVIKNIYGTPIFQPNYSVHLTVVPDDPQDYMHSPIDAWVNAVGHPTPGVKVHLVQ